MRHVTRAARLAGMSGLACLGLLGSCTSRDHEPLAGSFGLCSSDPGPEPDGIGDLVIDNPVARAGESLDFRWTFADPSVLLGPELVVDCWTGTEWVPVWVTDYVFLDSRTADLVVPGEEVLFEESGWSEREGKIVVPPEAPPGTYRIGNRIESVQNVLKFDVRFEVVE